MKALPKLPSLLFPMLWISMLFYSTYAYSQPQNVIMLDDFESFPLNTLGHDLSGFKDTVHQGDIALALLQGDNAFCHNGQSLRILYNVDNDSSFSGLVSKLPFTDLSNYHYLSFWIKSTQNQDYLMLELKHQNGTSGRVALWNYLPCGPTEEWQKVIIPMDAFWNLTDRSQIAQFVLTFDNYLASQNGSPEIGEVHVDEILFGSFFPGYVKMDHFDDLIKTNATGGNIGEFSQNGSINNYVSSLACQGGLACSCDLGMEYHNNSGDDFGGIFFILGGGLDGWQKIGRSMSGKYHQLHLALSAEDNLTNPQNVKLELTSDPISGGSEIIHDTRLLGINTNYQSYSIPFSSLNPPITDQLIKEFTLVFEKSKQATFDGFLHVDDIEFRSATYTGPDTLKPDDPDNLAVDATSVPDTTIVWQAGSTHSISCTIDTLNSRLESVRLEYMDISCPDQQNWICVEKKFVSINSLVNFSFSSEILPPFTELMFRVVEENYQGKTSISDSIYVQVGGTPMSADVLWEEAYKLFEVLRAPTGVYLDAVRFQPPQFHPASVATTGMGLVILTIADSLGIINNAETLVLETLKSMNGLTAGFSPDRNAKGWFRHFIDPATGDSAWSSEFSSIDSGILTAGALFSKKYFSDNDSIQTLADKLCNTTDWASMIADPSTGGIYLTSNKQGVGSGITLPFNEYMLVAWLAKEFDSDSIPGTTLWNNFYADPDSLPTSSYKGIDVLTDYPGNFLPGFVPQFNFYLCNYFTTHPGYLDYFEHAMLVDKQWWRDSTEVNCHIWGFGAGACNGWSQTGYCADNIKEHPGTISSPHIIAGFIPVNPDGINDIRYLYDNVPYAKYSLPNPENSPILWRFSTENNIWKAGDIQGVDFSSFLLGLADHPDLLVSSLFETFNNYDKIKTPIDPNLVEHQFRLGQNIPNPFEKTTEIPFEIYRPSRVNIHIYNALGIKVRSFHRSILAPGKHTYIWDGTDDHSQAVPGGVYHYQIESEGLTQVKSMILVRN